MKESLTLAQSRLLDEQGHVILPISDGRMFDDLAYLLGTPIPSRTGGPTKDLLEVRDSEEAHTRSMSKQFGRGQFPFHTDMAHLPIPPRYVLLRSIGEENSRKTFVLNAAKSHIADVRKDALERDIWFVQGGKAPFFTPVINKTLVRGRSIFRYDSEIMKPADGVDGDSVSAMTLIRSSLPYSEYILTANECLVIDNWSALHGRGAEPPKTDKDTRLLERYLVLENL